jgi:hypothetical protein
LKEEENYITIPDLFVFYSANEAAVMAPAQFGTQCVPNWKGKIKCPDIVKIVLSGYSYTDE